MRRTPTGLRRADRAAVEALLAAVLIRNLSPSAGQVDAVRQRIRRCGAQFERATDSMPSAAHLDTARKPPAPRQEHCPASTNAPREEPHKGGDRLGRRVPLNRLEN